MKSIRTLQIIFILLVAILFGLLTYATVYFAKKAHDLEVKYTPSTSPSPTASASPSWQIFTSKQYPLSFKVPSTWLVTEETPRSDDFRIIQLTDDQDQWITIHQFDKLDQIAAGSSLTEAIKNNPTSEYIGPVELSGLDSSIAATSLGEAAYYSVYFGDGPYYNIVFGSREASSQLTSTEMQVLNSIKLTK